MKTTIMVEKEVDIKYIIIEVPVRYEEDDIPNNFPLRDGDMWRAKVNIDTGCIVDWPCGESGEVCMKVCDEGIYTLLDENSQIIEKIEQDYVPNRCIPGEYGDYIDLKIDKNGCIYNWYSPPCLDQFFEK